METDVSDDAEVRGPNAVDIHVGRRVRMRRRMLGVSQQALAAALGRTFQQVQKYERGANRISASKLYEIAQTLQTPISFFFEGLEDAGTTKSDAPGGSVDRTLSDFLATPEGLDLAQAFPRIGGEHLRRKVLGLARALAEEDEALAQAERARQDG